MRAQKRVDTSWNPARDEQLQTRTLLLATLLVYGHQTANRRTCDYARDQANTTMILNHRAGLDPAPEVSQSEPVL